MIRPALSLFLIIFCLGMECPMVSPVASQIPGSMNCELIDVPNFNVVIPCAANSSFGPERADDFLYEASFMDEDMGELFAVEVISAATVNSGNTGASIGSTGGARLDGVLTTSSGDTVILATIRVDGLDIFRGFTMDDSGNLLRLSIASATRSFDLLRFYFNNILVENGNGERVFELLESETTLLAPYQDEYAILSDQTVWQVDFSVNESMLTSWEQGDSVFSLPADAFFRDGFLTKIPDLVSFPFSFVGEADILTVVQVDETEICTDIELSDGNVWTACSDRTVLNSLNPGDSVALFVDISTFVTNLQTGRSARVSN